MKRIYEGLFLVFALWFMAMAGIPITMNATAEPVTLKVYNPNGSFEVTQVHAPRLDTLHGKTICEVSNNSWDDYRTFPFIRDLLQKQYPTAKFVPYTELPMLNMQVDIPDLEKAIKAKGCQGAIVGNAG